MRNFQGAQREQPQLHHPQERQFSIPTRVELRREHRGLIFQLLHKDNH